jgi:hypothetical protein
LADGAAALPALIVVVARPVVAGRRCGPRNGDAFRRGFGSSRRRGVWWVDANRTLDGALRRTHRAAPRLGDWRWIGRPRHGNLLGSARRRG